MNRELKAGDLLKVGRSECVVGVGGGGVDKRRERVFGKPLRAYYGFFIFLDSSFCPEGERRWSFWKKPRKWWASQGVQR